MEPETRATAQNQLSPVARLLWGLFATAGFLVGVGFGTAAVVEAQNAVEKRDWVRAEGEVSEFRGQIEVLFPKPWGAVIPFEGGVAYLIPRPPGSLVVGQRLSFVVDSDQMTFDEDEFFGESYPRKNASLTHWIGHLRKSLLNSSIAATAILASRQRFWRRLGHWLGRA